MDNRVKPGELYRIYRIVENGAEMCGGVNLSALRNASITTPSASGNKTSPGAKTPENGQVPHRKKRAPQTGGYAALHRCSP